MLMKQLGERVIGFGALYQEVVTIEKSGSFFLAQPLAALCHWLVVRADEPEGLSCHGFLLGWELPVRPVGWRGQTGFEFTGY